MSRQARLIPLRSRIPLPSMTIVRKQFFCQLLVGHIIRQRIMDTEAFCSLQYACNSVPRTQTACCYVRFVDSETVKPQNFSVIGHLHDLHKFIYTHLHRCINLLYREIFDLHNERGTVAQSVRFNCSIRAVRVPNLPRNIHFIFSYVSLHYLYTLMLKYFIIFVVIICKLHINIA